MQLAMLQKGEQLECRESERKDVNLMYIYITFSLFQALSKKSDGVRHNLIGYFKVLWKLRDITVSCGFSQVCHYF